LSTVSTRSSRKSPVWPLIYVAVALTTMATLVLELSLTRIFSVVFYYHYAFLAISIALFGLGAGGVLSYYFPQRGRELHRKLAFISTIASVAVIVTLFVLLHRAPLPAVYFCAAVPFLLAGLIVSLAIGDTVERIDRVYFFDLLGAAGGCMLLIPLLNIVGGPSAVLGAAALYAAASAVWFGLVGSARGRAAGVSLALALVALLIYNKDGRVFDVVQAKGRILANEIFVRWNSFSRIAVTIDKDENRTIVIDADATTGIANLDFQHLPDWATHDLRNQGPGFPYSIRPAAKTLIIGAGGGWDVSRAIASGSSSVTGVEINPIIANTIMRRQYPQWSNRLYLRPDVNIAVEDGRSFIRGSSERYQVIQATLVDTWASTAAGAFALSENNLYTTDAFVDYLSHLSPDGMLAISRWGFDPPRESLRVISLALAAFDRLGEPDPARHIIVIRENREKLAAWGALDTILIARKPFSAEDLARAHAAIAEAGFQPVFLPDQRPPNAFTALLTAPDRQAFYDGYRYDVRPVGDDRPFFFYTVQPRDLWSFRDTANTTSADFKVNLAVPTLFSLVAVSLLATLVTLLLPPVLVRTRLPAEPGVKTFLLYFVCLGAGYILIQVGLIQKLILLLGRPTYSLTVVIFAMLLASGLGSYFSRRLVGTSDLKLGRVLVAIFFVVALLASIAGPITTAGVAWPLPVKVLVTVLLIAPAAFLMGIPFPSGLSRLEQWHPPSVRWAWSLNAAASVLGSTLAIALAIYLGLRITLLAGGALYLAAWMFLRSGSAVVLGRRRMP
jgi:hypothetical protein